MEKIKKIISKGTEHRVHEKRSIVQGKEILQAKWLTTYHKRPSRTSVEKLVKSGELSEETWVHDDGIFVHSTIVNEKSLFSRSRV